MAAPIALANRIAGCLLVSSRQIDYFVVQARQQVISDYAELLALAFEPGEFYPLEHVDLRVLPPPEVQHTYFASFQQRVIRLMQQESRLIRSQAELRVWQEIETVLIAQSSSDSIHSDSVHSDR